MLNINFKLKDYILAMMWFSILLFNGCFSSPVPNSQTLNKQKKFVDQEQIENNTPQAEIGKPSIEENKTINPTPASQGSGYLSEGPTLSIGVIDGDEELKVLQKVRRLEARLETEKDKVKSLSAEIAKLQTEKKGIEKDFADTKKELEEKTADLLDISKSLESKLTESEERATTAEQELASVKKELLKAQIVETKAQQELYKLKIESLKQDKE